MISRIVILLHLALICVSLNCLFPQASQATGIHCQVIVGKSSTKEDNGAVLNLQVTEWGQSRKDAEEKAARDVAAKTGEFLRERNPRAVWSPSADYVREHLTWSEPERKQDQDQLVPVGEEKVKAECWSWKVAVTEAGYEEMLREDAQVHSRLARQEREVRAEERMLLLVKVLAVIVAGLLAVIGYIRLDEWTKGYYSRWLALAGAGLLAGVALALWLSLRTWNW